MVSQYSLEAREPGWFTSDFKGITEFWPSETWCMTEDEPSGEDQKYTIRHREDDDALVHQFGRGYTIFTASVVNHQIMVSPGWKPIPTNPTWWYAPASTPPEGPLTHCDGAPCENGVSCYPESRCAGCW